MSEAIFDGWYDIAGPLNKYVPWITFALSGLWWVLFPLTPLGYNPYFLGLFAWCLVCAILSGFFYLIILQEKIENRDLSKPTHIWLLVCFGLSLFSLGGAFIWVQFAMVGVLSERPFWQALREGSYRYY